MYVYKSAYFPIIVIVLNLVAVVYIMHMSMNGSEPMKIDRVLLQQYLLKLYYITKLSVQI
jgi:hypothetical protein